LIKQVMDRLPAEKRKGYLLNPIPNLTYESMIQTILGKDGITPEMLKEQQDASWSNGSCRPARRCPQRDHQAEHQPVR
jgi:hypothetical protein